MDTVRRISAETDILPNLLGDISVYFEGGNIWILQGVSARLKSRIFWRTFRLAHLASVTVANALFLLKLYYMSLDRITKQRGKFAANRSKEWNEFAYSRYRVYSCRRIICLRAWSPSFTYRQRQRSGQGWWSKERCVYLCNYTALMSFFFICRRNWGMNISINRRQNNRSAIQDLW